jgi:sRNA-binding carbon storage regulator CsrA
MLVVWRENGKAVKIDDLIVIPRFDNENYELEIVSPEEFRILEIKDDACLYKHVLMVYQNRSFIADDYRVTVLETNSREVILQVESLDDDQFVININAFRGFKHI